MKIFNDFLIDDKKTNYTTTGKKEKKNKFKLPKIISQIPKEKNNSNSLLTSTAYNNISLLTDVTYCPTSTRMNLKNTSYFANLMTTSSIQTEQNQDWDKERSSLSKFYYDVNKEKKTYTKDQKNQTFLRFGIQNKISDEDKVVVTSKINKTKIHASTLNLNTTASHNVSKTVVHTYYEDYKSPVKSLKKLNRNKQIHDKLLNMMTQRQVQMYQEKLEEAIIFNNKVGRMPEAKIITTTFNLRMKEKLEDKTIKHETNTTEEDDQEAQGDKSFNKYSKMLSRDDLLSCVDYQGTKGPFSKFLPSARCQASLTIAKDGFAYLIGGISNDRLIDIWALDLKKLTWKSVNLTGEVPLPRFGHSAVAYKNQIFVYGGNIKNCSIVPKEDITIINLSENMIELEKCYNKGNLKWRRNHTAQALNNQMLIHGGIDEYENFLSDSYVLDLETLRWTELKVKEDNFKVFPVAYHSSVLVISPDKKLNPLSTIFRFAELPLNFISNIKVEGLYVFGGIDREGVCNNTLRIMKLGKKPLEWYKPNCEGSPPSPRHSASMSLYEELGVIFLYGGKDPRSDTIVFDDVYILDLEYFKWTRVKIFEESAIPRAEHSSFIFNNKMIIFGGTGVRTFIGSSLFLVELDFFENKKMKKEWDNIRKLKNEVKAKTSNDEIVSKQDGLNKSSIVRRLSLNVLVGESGMDRESMRLQHKMSNNNLVGLSKDERRRQSKLFSSNLLSFQKMI